MEALRMQINPGGLPARRVVSSIREQQDPAHAVSLDILDRTPGDTVALVSRELQSQRSDAQYQVCIDKLRATGLAALGTATTVALTQVSAPAALVAGVVSLVAVAHQAQKAIAGQNQVSDLTDANDLLWSRADGQMGISSVSQNGCTLDPFVDKYGPWAVVTGASAGIGKSFCDQLAAKGMNLVMVARNADKLQLAAEELRSEHGVQVRAIAADLGQDGFMTPIREATGDIRVGLLVNNAGILIPGPVTEASYDSQRKMMDVNLGAPLQLCHEFGSKMAERGRGGIINVSSMAAYHGVANQTTYSATKAALLNLSEGMTSELRSRGVDVIASTPGPVATEAAVGTDFSKIPIPVVQPEQVAADAIDKLGQKSVTTPGFLASLSKTLSAALLPRDVNSALAGYFYSKASGHE